MEETNDYFFIEFTTESGNTYQVGYPKSAGYTAENLEAEIAETNKKLEQNANDEYKEIRCDPTGASYITRAAINIGLVGAYVWYEQNPHIYHYQIQFANYKGWKFWFKDESGDVYSCTTPRNGNHTINYNSPKPTMIGVK